jgi:protein-S-isoprenylcysteine O-methyltransferase Ste14
MKCSRLWSDASPPSRLVSETPRFGRLAVALARRRVPLGFIFAAVVLWLASPTRASVAAGGVIAAVGEAIRIWAAGHLQKSKEVTSSGPYRFTAHPLYVGSSVMGVGLAVACASAAAAALIAVYLASTLAAAIAAEERFLRDAFGGEYGRYRRELSAKAAPIGVARSARRFSAGRALANREHRALVGLLLVVLLLAWKATYNEPFWRSGGPRAVRPGS